MAKVTGKVNKERTEKNLLRVRGCGGFVHHFMAEREGPAPEHGTHGVSDKGEPLCTP